MKPLDDFFSDSHEKRAVGPVSNTVLDWGKEKADELMAPPSEERIKLDTLGEMFNPAHDQELARIKTQAMLTEFMADDPVISTYDPEEVSNAYNQVAQLAPRTSSQPAVMRGLLRKLLQQQDALETFDADQITQVEERLKRINEPPQRLLAPYRDTLESGPKAGQ